MLVTPLITLLSAAVAYAIPAPAPAQTNAPRSGSGLNIQTLVGGSKVSGGATVQYINLLSALTYYVSPSAGSSIKAGDKFTTVIVSSDGSGGSSSTLVAAWSGSTLYDLFGIYFLGLPTKIYASWSIPSLSVGGNPFQICTYIFEQSSSVKSVSNPSRAAFDYSSFASKLGVGSPVAEICLTVINGHAPSSTASSSAAPTSSSTISTAPSSSSTSSSTISAAPSSSDSSSASASASASASTSTSSTSSSSSSSAAPSSTGPLPAYQTTVTFNGQTYINKGLVGFGAISGDAVDSQGETIGGIGSAIALESIARNDDGTYTGVMLAQPDRGHNTASTTDYIARRHRIGFTLDPYYDSTVLNYTDAKSTFALAYQSSLLYYEQDGTPTTGLDALAIRQGEPPLPIANATYNHISTDAEGLVINADGSSWVSDEYGPYIYKYSSDGKLLQTISPPLAVLPYLNGSLDFSSAGIAPTVGRVQNQGFEGLTASPDGTKLYALLQSGLTQDLDSSGEGRYTRFFAYDVSGTPTLESSYVLQLPVTNGKAKALAQSDFHYLSEDTFVVLSRDGKGNGNDDNDSKHKDFLLFSTSGATNIKDTVYTTTDTAVAPGGVLVSNVTAIVPTEFIDMIDDTQLGRFGICNSCDYAVNLINGKWESIAIASIQDPAYPNDYFLFSFSDNDFISLNGIEDGAAYVDAFSAEYGYSLDNQALVWRVTLPAQ